jgi:uncharacterized protein (TIGR03000 family)
MLVLAAAMLLGTTGYIQAAPHSGGSHAGGFHAGGGGYHAGGFHASGSHGSYYGGSSRGYHPYGGYGYGRGGYGRYGYGFYPGLGYGYGYGLGYGYPAYGYWGDSYPYYDYGNYPAYGYSDDVDLNPAVVQPYYSTSTPVPPDTTAHISVNVPDPNAEVLIDGAKTVSKGTVREFRSPPLAPGRYTYEIKATWNENGHKETMTQHVDVTPGGQALVNFMRLTPQLGRK